MVQIKTIELIYKVVTLLTTLTMVTIVAIVSVVFYTRYLLSELYAGYRDCLFIQNCTHFLNELVIRMNLHYSYNGKNYDNCINFTSLA